MSLNFVTGRALAVRAAVNRFVKTHLSGTDPVILLVPAQFTLEAERDALTAAGVQGSFQLEVLSPERLYARVFGETGWPREARIDEQGRVMMAHAAAEKRKKQLTWYKSAVSRPGFAERAASQIALFKQSGLTPPDIREKAEQAQGPLHHKLHDLFLIYEAYEAALAGRFLDGEDEQARAALHMAGAKFLSGAHVCVHGFDIITPPLGATILALCGAACDVTVALTLVYEDEARDAYLFAPVKRSLERLDALAKEAGIARRRVRAEAPKAASGAIEHLERELFAVPPRVWDGEAPGIQLAMLKNADDEAGYAAAVARRLARARGWRYRDMAVACATSDGAAYDALRRAFARAGVPLFLAEGRSCDRHPLAQFVLFALRAASRGLQAQDMALYIRSGFSGLTDEESDRLINYALTYALRGKRWLLPVAFGPEDEKEALECARAKLMGPLEQFILRLSEATCVRERLVAVVQLLDDTLAYEKIEETRALLEAQGLGSWAMEGAQVYKRLIDALDQMEELLGEEKLSAGAIYELLRRSLGQAVVKALPQSADAVEGGPLEHLMGKPVKALIVVGVSDALASRDDQLLNGEEVLCLGRAVFTLTDEERARMMKLRVKSLLSLAGDFLLVTRPMSDPAGRALYPGALANEMMRLMPRLRVCGGVTEDEEMTRMRLEQADVALSHMPLILPGQSRPAREALAALESMDETRAALDHVKAARAHRVFSEALPLALAKKLLAPGTMSVSRLEKYAKCPFAHFAAYGLKPEEFREFDLSPRDAGNFYHEALEKFVRDNAGKIHALTAEETAALMDAVTDQLIDRMSQKAGYEGGLIRHELRSLKSVARRAALVAASQMKGSRFKPVALEKEVERGEARLKLDEMSALSGRIDRVDEWADGEARYVRVIDYKSGGRSLNLNEVYHGLELQLIVYLAAVLAQRGGKGAGAFYFNVSDPLIATDERDPDAVEEERLKKLKLSGVVLGDDKVMEAMGDRPDLIVGGKYNKDGTFRASATMVEEGDFDVLIGHALGKARQSLAAMRAGDTAIAPYRLSADKTACKHCEHKTLCQFEDALPGAEPRRLKPFGAKKALEMMREERLGSGASDKGRGED